MGARIQHSNMKSANVYYIIKHSLLHFCFLFTTFITHPITHSHIDLLKLALPSFHSYFQEFPVTLVTFHTITFYHHINKSTCYCTHQAPRSIPFYFLLKIISPFRSMQYTYTSSCWGHIYNYSYYNILLLFIIKSLNILFPRCLQLQVAM